MAAKKTSNHPKQGWLDRSNAKVLYHLERQGRTGPGLVPFLGAGVSTTFGFKNWRDLLLDASPPSVAVDVEKRLDKGDYEGAAERLLKKLGEDGFQNMVAEAAGDGRLASVDFLKGSVSLLPLLCQGLAITTNFDRVLERAFEASGRPFESVVSGPRPDLIVDALHGNRRVLVKLHGDWQDRVGRTFAWSDYEANYGDEQFERKRGLLAATEELLFSSRSLLFVGASLGPDRTVDVLRRVHERYAGIRHFAIMNAPKARTKFDDLEEHLRSCGVLPLWYRADQPEEHSHSVKRLLSLIVERISVRTTHRRAQSRKPRAVPLPDLSDTTEPITKLASHFERVVRLIDDGRITFFLGSAIHAPTKLMAAGFYRELARAFNCEALEVERFAVAQYITDRHGREELNSEIRKLFARTELKPRETHELFAAWEELKDRSGVRRPYPLVITTNYDDLLERRLTEAGLPFHLFSYQNEGPDQGLFYHQCEKKSLRVIERPANIGELSDAFVIVKLNGGLDSHKRIPESFVTARLDYWNLAVSIPQVLPAVIRERLAANPILFLGHGLAAPDIESLVRFAHKDHSGPRSWAVATNLNAAKYWRHCGVEGLRYRVADYVSELRRHLSNS